MVLQCRRNILRTCANLFRPSVPVYKGFSEEKFWKFFCTRRVGFSRRVTNMGKIYIFWTKNMKIWAKICIFGKNICNTPKYVKYVNWKRAHFKGNFLNRKMRSKKLKYAPYPEICIYNFLVALDINWEGGFRGAIFRSRSITSLELIFNLICN